ncbi:MAG: S8 family serine peptidase, partial [Verrucomicrobiae bacterium]|nr:S8 family serine peptidase [Verrucomicrobiae bacterium]
RDQWHLRNIGDRQSVEGEDANLYPAWNQNVSGVGVHIAIVDTGIEGDHPDLALNYRDDLDFDYLDNDNSAYPLATDETHGTAVSGVAAAAANDSCGVGAAFNAELIGVRLIDENRGVSASRQASAIAHQSDIVDIYNNSWGPDTDNGALMAGPVDLSFSAIRNAINNGRNGLGCIFVWAAGNGRAIGSNVNYDGWSAHRYSIAVGAVGNQGVLSSYSEPGAPMLVCAPSSGGPSGIRTTDLSGSDGVDPGDCRIDFGGTSSASPLVAGIVALMLEANPNLNWRDVQHILAKTAVKISNNHSDWVRNGAGLWVNHSFGFGRVDAAATVRASLSWPGVGEEVESNSGFLNIGQSIPDNSTTGIQVNHTVSEKIRVEHVSVTLDIDAAAGDTTDWGDLEIRLTSPGGTESILASPHNDAQREYSEWTYWTVRCLDEESAGTWTLNVADRRSGNAHIAKTWQLNLYGTELSEQDNHAPVASDDTFTIQTRTSRLDVLANDTDEDGDPLEVISVYRSANGTTRILPSGQLEYTTRSGSASSDTLFYTIQDSHGGIAKAQVNLSISGPEANDDQVGTLKNTPVTVDVLDNDRHTTGGSIRLLDFDQANHGLVSALSGSNLSYQPEEGFAGVDSFAYQITDDSGGESEATVQIFVTQEGDYALLFDGKNDQVVLANSQNLLSGSPFTLEAWIRPEGWGEGETGYGRIMDNGSIVFYIHGTGFPSYSKESLLISLDHSNGARSIYNTPAGSIHLNEWQHVAISYDNSSTVRMYIDGVSQSLTVPFDNASGTVATSSQNFIVGEASDTPRAFEGAMDEVRIWNQVRTQTEIQNARNHTLSGNEAGLLVYLPMNEGAGSTTQDLQSPANNGTITEARWIKGILENNTGPLSVQDEIHYPAGRKVIVPVAGNKSDSDGDILRVASITSVSEGTASFVGDSIIYQPPKDYIGTVRIDYVLEDGYNGTAASVLILYIGEGLSYTVWEANNYQGSLGTRSSDSDLDTLNNFTEYAFGTDPRSGFVDGSLWKLNVDPADGKTLFTYTILKNSLDVGYRLLISTDLAHWSIAREGTDFETISVMNQEPDLITRTLAFKAVGSLPVFVKVEADYLGTAE